jgi:hypothetical protein
MGANYGGTEIRAALQAAFGSRDRDGPTSIFVLTDGEVGVNTRFGRRSHVYYFAGHRL